MSTTLYSLASQGLEAALVKIEVDHYGGGNPGTVIVGLGDTAVQESRERVRAAIKNCHYHFPRGRVVVNLAPADVRKSGPCFELPMALGLISLGQGLQYSDVRDAVFFGELSLEGQLCAVDGILALVAAAKQAGFKRVFLPQSNATEAALVDDMEVYAFRHLSEVVDCLTAVINLDDYRISPLSRESQRSLTPLVDMADISGQHQAKRALEIAAAGGHNVLLNGSPGSGKTMMAKALSGILPALSYEEALEVTKLYSLSGLLPADQPFMSRRPFRMVHHTASGAALVGGGRIPMPGEISLAHRGVLFLDEMAEFPSSVLELLRQPLEDRQITISRASGSLTYPSQFILCAATNPCPCGYHGVLSAQQVCDCPPHVVERYQRKISGPLLDRIDLYCAVSPVSYQDLGRSKAESTAAIALRVQEARNRQLKRFEESSCLANAEMSVKEIQQYCLLTSSVQEILSQAMNRLSLSARSYHRLLKVARTIADLRASEHIAEADVLEALQYRRYS